MDLTAIPSRITDQINRTGDCWLWTGQLTYNGYGRTEVNDRYFRAHRYLYEVLVGPIPEGLELDHLCRVRHCVNPGHLEPVTHAENMRRSEMADSANSNSPTAINARKASCLRGHPFSGANTYQNSNGWRRCRTCRREQNHQYKARKRARRTTRLDSVTAQVGGGPEVD